MRVSFREIYVQGGAIVVYSEVRGRIEAIVVYSEVRGWVRKICGDLTDLQSLQN